MVQSVWIMSRFGMSRDRQNTEPTYGRPLTLPAIISCRLMDRARKVNIGAGQTLFFAGDPGDGCYWIDEGLLKVHVISYSGSDRILSILGAGTIVGELSMFDGAPRSASVSAIRPSQLSFVTRAHFEAMLHEHPEVYRELAIVLAHRLRDIDDAITASFAQGPRGAHVAGLGGSFWPGCRQRSHRNSSKGHQSDIAAMAGVVRESFSRVMHDWLSRSLVSRLSGYYCLENKSALEQESDF